MKISKTKIKKIEHAKEILLQHRGLRDGFYNQCGQYIGRSNSYFSILMKRDKLPNYSDAVMIIDFSKNHFK